jgi:hypothetical protein
MKDEYEQGSDYYFTASGYLLTNDELEVARALSLAKSEIFLARERVDAALLDFLGTRRDHELSGLD